MGTLTWDARPNFQPLMRDTRPGARRPSANPAAMQQYSGLKHADDRTDARWLTHMLRVGLLPEGYIYPREQRALRDLLRKRGRLMRQRTANLLSLQNLVHRNTGQRHGVRALRSMEFGDRALFCPPPQPRCGGAWV